MDNIQDMPWLCVGVILGAHGIKGQVRIKSYMQNPLDIAAFGAVYNETRQDSWHILTPRLQKADLVIAHLKGVTDRTQAENLAGVSLYLSRSLLPDLSLIEEEFYHTDLIGLTARFQDGRIFGRVKAVHNFGAGDMLEISPSAGGGGVMWPFTKEFVPEISLHSKEVVLIPPLGWLDKGEELSGQDGGE
jgi:16S rRNA processing protein RimM